MAATTDARTIPVTSAAAVVAATVTIVPEAERGRAGGRGGGHRVARVVGKLLRLALPVVRLDHPLRLAADRVDQAGAVVVELPRVLADDLVLVLPAPLGEVRA